MQLKGPFCDASFQDGIPLGLASHAVPLGMPVPSCSDSVQAMRYIHGRGSHGSALHCLGQD